MHRTLEQLRLGFFAELRGLDAAGTRLRPPGSPDAWTVQQIVEHLMLTYESTTGTMLTRLERGAPTKAKATMMDCVAQFAVARLGYVPKGRKAPEMVQPPVSGPMMNGSELSHAFAAALDRMDAQLAAVEHTFGPGRSVSHAVLGPMSMANWRGFHLAHGRHHLRQVRHILKGSGAQREEEAVHG